MVIAITALKKLTIRYYFRSFQINFISFQINSFKLYNVPYIYLLWIIFCNKLIWFIVVGQWLWRLVTRAQTIHDYGYLNFKHTKMLSHLNFKHTKMLSHLNFKHTKMLSKFSDIRTTRIHNLHSRNFTTAMQDPDGTSAFCHHNKTNVSFNSAKLERNIGLATIMNWMLL